MTMSLDKLITRVVEVPAPIGVISYVFSDGQGGLGGGVGVRSWDADPNGVRVNTVDMDGAEIQNLNALQTPFQISAVVGSAAAVTRSVDAVFILKVLGFISGYQLRFADPLTGSGLLRLTVPSIEGAGLIEVKTSLFARRRDFSARDTLNVSDAGVYTLGDTRFIVSDLPNVAWTVGDEFTDDEGRIWQVRGVSRVNRTRLEILAHGDTSS